MAKAAKAAKAANEFQVLDDMITRAESDDVQGYLELRETLGSKFAGLEEEDPAKYREYLDRLDDVNEAAEEMFARQRTQDSVDSAPELVV